MRTCKVCGKEKYLEDFRISKGIYRKYICIRCDNLKRKEENAKKDTEFKRIKKEKESLFVMGLKKCSCCNETLFLNQFYKTHNNGYRSQCSKCFVQKTTDYKKRNRAKIKERNAKDAERMYIKNKLYREINKERIKINARKQKRAKKDNSPLYRLTLNMRKRLILAVKAQSGCKSAKTKDLIGCSFEELRSHLSSLFSEGMTWDNYGRGGWCVDHIIPCSSFDLNNPEQQRKCFHYTNLQPLWEIDNIRKSNKLKN